MDTAIIITEEGLAIMVTIQDIDIIETVQSSIDLTITKDRYIIEHLTTTTHTTQGAESIFNSGYEGSLFQYL